MLGWSGPGAVVRAVTRDDAIRVGIFTLGRWHRQNHGDRCVCLEGEELGAQSAAVVDALAAEGITFDGYSGIDRGPLGPPVVGEGGPR
jgi:hypothetical protein